MDYQTRIVEIDKELEALRGVIAKREQERAALQSLADMQSDDVDVVFKPKSSNVIKEQLLEKITATSSVHLAPQSSEVISAPDLNKNAANNGPKSKKLQLFIANFLEFLGQDGKRLQPDVATYYSTIGRKLGNDKDPLSIVRTDLWKIRTDFGYIENPSKGFYRVTKAGMDFLESLKGESPSATNTEAFNLQPTSLNGHN